jgi:hypothetical protein
MEHIRHDTVSIFSVLEMYTGQVFTKVIEDHTALIIIETFSQHVATANSTETLHYICVAILAQRLSLNRRSV